jgi:hypothetical protein
MEMCVVVHVRWVYIDDHKRAAWKEGVSKWGYSMYKYYTHQSAELSVQLIMLITHAFSFINFNKSIRILLRRDQSSRFRLPRRFSREVSLDCRTSAGFNGGFVECMPVFFSVELH